MKKGFTLIEVLAVIVLSALLTAIVFPIMLNGMVMIHGKMDQAKINLLYQGADRYLSKNRNAHPLKEGNVYCVTIEDLEGSEDLDFEEVTEEMKEKVVRARVGKKEKLVGDMIV